MNLNFDISLVENYHSASQITRVLTESWFANNMFCPRCGSPKISHFENNRPVADFFCDKCNSEYELKSKRGNLERKINDGAYSTMIQRITENNNPDLFCMNYEEEKVVDLIFIPKHFFTPSVIEKRKPLKEDARRAGWVGCNILIDKIPNQAKIQIISNGIVRDVSQIISNVRKCDSLATKDIVARGWLLDVLNCVNAVNMQDFTLTDIYKFEESLFIKHPLNNNIQPKIRQQLQILRDKGFIEFLGNGKYRKKL